MSSPAPAAPSAAGRVARNSGLTAGAEVLAKLCSLAFFAIIARQLGEAALGDFVFAMAIASLLWSFAGFGIDRLATRDFATDPASAAGAVVPMAALKFAAASAGTLATALALALVDDNHRRMLLVLLLGLGTALGLAASSAQTVFVASERGGYVFLTRVPTALVTALAGIGVVLLGGDIVAAAAVTGVGAGLLGALWTYVLLVRNYQRPRFRVAPREWPRVVRAAVPFGLQEGLGQVIFRFDTVALAFLATSAVVGHYGAAYRILEATLFIAWSIGFAVLPMYSYIDRTRGELERVYEGSLKLTLLLMAPVATTLFVCARPIIDLFYGLPRYEDSVSLLQLLALAVAVYGFGHLAGLLVLVRRPGRLTVRASAAVALTNVAACFALIPWLGAEGAAIATLGSELLLALIGLALARPVTGAVRMGWILSPVVAAVPMALAMAPLADRLVVALPVGLAAYLVALLILEGRRFREDVRLFRSITVGRPEWPAGREPALRA